MKYIKQLLIILIISCIGELLNFFIPLPIPGSIYGMITGIHFSVNGNKLTITADTAPSNTVTITAEKKNSQRRGVITWTDGVYGPNGKLQDTVIYAQSVNPVKGYLNIKVSYGSAKIVKTSEDGKVEGISFTLTGNGINKTVTTGAGGSYACQFHVRLERPRRRPEEL